jgi:hypothetical protein
MNIQSVRKVPACLKFRCLAACSYLRLLKFLLLVRDQSEDQLHLALLLDFGPLPFGLLDSYGALNCSGENFLTGAVLQAK